MSDDTLLLADLRVVVGPRHVLAGGDASGFERDWTGRFGGAAACVVRPADTEEVAAVVQIARRHGVALVPQGGNTGLVGGSVPRPTGPPPVVVSTTRMSTIGDVDELALQLTAGAGATVAAVRQRALEVGLDYGVDFGARDVATIGGTIATNAGGHNVLAHGMTRAQVIGLEAVLADGSVLSRMSGLTKDNVGYDLTGLLVGSEGTLGIVTRARLRLVTRCSARVAVLLTFPGVAHCVGALVHLQKVGGLLAAELMVEKGLRLVSEQLGLPVLPMGPTPAVLLVEVEGDCSTGELVDRLVAHVGELDDLIDGAVASTTSEISRLWAYRDGHPEAIARLGTPVKLDVALPLAEIPDFIDALARLAAPSEAYVFGHLGDGNLHVNLIGPDDGAIVSRILGEVVERGGSIGAEHGIGVAKVELIGLSRTAVELQVLRAIKQALDPDGLFNPGVLFS